MILHHFLQTYDVVVVVDIEMDFGKLSDPQALNACLAFD